MAEEKTIIIKDEEQNLEEAEVIAELNKEESQKDEKVEPEKKEEIKVEPEKKKEPIQIKLPKKITKKTIVEEIRKLKKLKGEEIPSNAFFKKKKRAECDKMLADMVKNMVNEEILKDKPKASTLKEDRREYVDEIDPSVRLMGARFAHLNNILLKGIAMMNNSFQKVDRYKINMDALNKISNHSRPELIAAYSEIYLKYRKIIDKYFSPVYTIIMANVTILVCSLNGVNPKIDVNEAQQYVI